MLATLNFGAEGAAVLTGDRLSSRIRKDSGAKDKTDDNGMGSDESKTFTPLPALGSA